MNQNYLEKFLDIKVFKEHTLVNYWNRDVLSYSHKFDVAISKIEENLVSEIILSNWISGIIYALHNISLIDRVPTFIYLETEKYGSVFEKALKNKNTYSQFYIENASHGKGVHVIIKKISTANINSRKDEFNLHLSLEDNSNNKSKSYERYTKAISKFRI
ncbi:MAG: hypothetical protein KBD12_01615 [Candidatus Pacebacteria bacterium]|nr:hypothetical protein [Candidatus Paceibacterota bacterium]